MVAVSQVEEVSFDSEFVERLFLLHYLKKITNGFYMWTDVSSVSTRDPPSLVVNGVCTLIAV